MNASTPRHEGEPPEPGSVRRENALCGYQVAASLMTYEGNAIWTRFSAMLVAHSIILVVIGTAGDQIKPTAFRWALPVAGLLLCLTWLFVTKRGYDHYGYWIVSMRELEERFLAPEVITISRGSRFAEGKPVTFLIDGAIVSRRMSRLGHTVRVAQASYGVVGIFALVYVAYLIHVIIT